MELWFLVLCSFLNSTRTHSMCWLFFSFCLKVNWWNSDLSIKVRLFGYIFSHCAVFNNVMVTFVEMSTAVLHTLLLNTSFFAYIFFFPQGSPPLFFSATFSLGKSETDLLPELSKKWKRPKRRTWISFLSSGTKLVGNQKWREFPSVVHSEVEERLRSSRFSAPSQFLKLENVRKAWLTSYHLGWYITIFTSLMAAVCS